MLVEGVKVNTWKIAGFLTGLLLLPLVAGLVVKARVESITARLSPVFERVSTVSLQAIPALIMAINFEGVLRIFRASVILFALPSALAGWLLGRRDAA